MCGRVDILAEISVANHFGCKGREISLLEFCTLHHALLLYSVSFYYVIVQQIFNFYMGSPVGTNSRPTHPRDSDRITVVENRSYPQPPRLLSSLSQTKLNENSSSEAVGSPRNSDTGAFSGVYSAKRLQGPSLPSFVNQVKFSVSNIFASCNGVATSGLLPPLLNISDANSLLLEQVDYAEVTDDQLGSGHTKTLQSPFEYTQEPITSRIDLTPKTCIQRIDPNGTLHSGSSSRYVYFAPTDRSDKTNQASDAHRIIPRRQLSYPDPPSKPRPRFLHKSTGSWKLKHEAGRHVEDCKIRPRSNRTLHGKFYHSEPIRRNSRFWLD